MATKFETNSVKYMTDLIRDFKLLETQAAGIVGNAGHESGGFELQQELNPIGGGRGGLGDFQWTGPRRVAFENWLARNSAKGWTAATYEANYSMLFRELVGPESKALDAVRKTETVEDATKVFMETFERPGVPHLDSRVTWAKKALTIWRESGIDPSIIRAEPLPGAVADGPSALEPLIDFVKAHPELIQILIGLVLPKQGQSSLFGGTPLGGDDKLAVQIRTAASVLIPIAVTALSATGIWGKLAGGLITGFMNARK